jgi:hypothetical protein
VIEALYAPFMLRMGSRARAVGTFGGVLLRMIAKTVCNVGLASYGPTVLSVHHWYSTSDMLVARADVLWPAPCRTCATWPPSKQLASLA